MSEHYPQILPNVFPNTAGGRRTPGFDGTKRLHSSSLSPCPTSTQLVTPRLSRLAMQLRFIKPTLAQPWRALLIYRVTLESH